MRRETGVGLLPLPDLPKGSRESARGQTSGVLRGNYGGDCMIDKGQLRKIIKDVLEPVGLYSQVGSDLLMGTSAQESHLGTYWEQVGGPALGIFQMEPATHDDIWLNYLRYHSDIVLKIGLTFEDVQDHKKLKYDLSYQILMCRIHYLRQPAALPQPGFLPSLAAYYKEYYNTPLGKGTEQEFIDNYNRMVV